MLKVVGGEVVDSIEVDARVFLWSLGDGVCVLGDGEVEVGFSECCFGEVDGFPGVCPVVLEYFVHCACSFVLITALLRRCKGSWMFLGWVGDDGEVWRYE